MATRPLSWGRWIGPGRCIRSFAAGSGRCSRFSVITGGYWLYPAVIGYNRRLFPITGSFLLFVVPGRVRPTRPGLARPGPAQFWVRFGPCGFGSVWAVLLVMCLIMWLTTCRTMWLFMWLFMWLTMHKSSMSLPRRSPTYSSKVMCVTKSAKPEAEAEPESEAEPEAEPEA